MQLSLTATEVRVLGALLEKEATTPDAYPLTLNALVTACNQTTGREPVLSLTDDEVMDALDSLRPEKLVRIVHPQTGARTARYRHVLHEAWDLDSARRAVVGLLALRGPQTASELRARSDRMHTFADAEKVHALLEELAAPPNDDYREVQLPALVVLLPRVPGQREARWVHLLSGDVDVDAVAATTAASAPSTRRTADAERIDALEARVGALGARLAALEASLGLDPAPVDTP